MQKISYLGFSALVLTLVVSAIASYSMPESFEDKRDGIILEMNELIRQRADEGNYMCCIEPPCDMCFLGHWIWDDGVCRCDDMIAKGMFDKVCPQCKRGIGDNQACSSVQQSDFNVDGSLCNVSNNRFFSGGIR